MRDYRKFCMPKTIKNPKAGDVLVTLNCGKQVYVSSTEFEKVKKFFKNYSVIEEIPSNVKEAVITYEGANGHDYVEIGGLLWATKNVGAQSETDGGLFFAWGETTGYTAEQVGTNKQFDWTDYAFAAENYDPSNPEITKYPDDDYVLDLEDDAASVNMGGEWRTPTYHEMLILEDLTTQEYVTNYKDSGMNGLLLTSIEDSSVKLFLPEAGVASFGNVVSSNVKASYWTSVTYSVDKGRDLYFDVDNSNFDDAQDRCKGLLIRGVIDPNDAIN